MLHRATARPTASLLAMSSWILACTAPSSPQGSEGGPATGVADDTGRGTEGSATTQPGSSSTAADPATTDTGDTPPDTGTPGDEGPGLPPPPTCGALEGLPHDPGPGFAAIEALADDTWLPLGPPAPDPQFGSARGRAWGGRAFAAASELRGAFFTGEGVHAYVKPDGYAMDDVWFYDAAQHAWIAVYPGNEIATFNQRVADGLLSIDADGQLQDGNGNAVPLHVLIHAWNFLAYDPVDHRFAFIAGDGMGEYYMPGFEQIQPGLAELWAQRDAAAVAEMSPWFYSVTNCAFERHAVETPTPGIWNQDYGSFVYASASDVYVYAWAGGVAHFDKGTGEWVTIADSGPRVSGYDNGVAYDPLRNRMYMGPGSDASSYGMSIYDVDDALWTNVPQQADGPAAFATNDASIFYDVVNDVVTVFHYSDGVHYTFAPDDGAWSQRPLPAVLLDAVSYASYSAFYDPEVNAYFVFAATDSEDNGTMFAYRFASP